MDKMCQIRIKGGIDLPGRKINSLYPLFRAWVKKDGTDLLVSPRHRGIDPKDWAVISVGAIKKLTKMEAMIEEV